MTERLSRLLGLALVGAAVAARTWVFGLASVSTGSMAPGILPGEVVLFWKFLEPVPGDVVALERGDGALHFKRLVAVGGDEVELSAGRLYVDGRALAAGEGAEVRWVDADCQPRVERSVVEALGARRWAVLPGGDHPRERVPAEHLFLLGDHRGNSSDSRQWGPARRETARGVVAGIAWSVAPCGRPRWDRVGFWDGRRPLPWEQK